MRVHLREVLDALDATNDSTVFVFSKSRNRVLLFFEGSLADDIEDNITLEDALNDPDSYILLPTEYEIHEYQIMEGFVKSMEEEGAVHERLHAMQGKGAFRRFKEKVSLLNLEDRWYRYRNDEYEKIAVEWCSSNGIESIKNK
ncbi:UPF0158 family protein [Proteiniclasticum ruminis]|uniref:Uncharacterized protein family (UPF0158) n=1 Tax=Proteiniclasticum ruminis TaxID=398199 RepID=A0A1G8JYS3_9CLOT|nr:UPF0158 family protein [Proteiniclasticum ruminis]SDI35700.1 Uncharacterised protein family (UPF0158) [Proteiniclasticum ruminis]